MESVVPHQPSPYLCILVMGAVVSVDVRRQVRRRTGGVLARRLRQEREDKFQRGGTEGVDPSCEVCYCRL